VLCLLVAGEAWRAEIVPLLVFAMTVAIAFDEDLAAAARRRGGAGGA